jgi:SM-20-related protein
MPPYNLAFDTAAGELAEDGWCVLSGLLTSPEQHALSVECADMNKHGQFKPAATGNTHLAGNLRGDSTHWFDPHAPSAAQRVFGDRTDALRISLNRSLLLGLVDSEAHYAIYPIGSGYSRHRDRLRDTDARVVSAVYYLNENWLDADGGELRLHLDHGRTHDISPQAGTLVLFLSADIEHEVLPARRTRMSIACWMRQRTIA